MNKIAQLDDYTSKAFNIKDGTFLGTSVFNLSFDKQNTIDWNGIDKLVPDQISATTSSIFYSSKKTILLENESDYDRTYSASIDAEYSGIAYSGSVNSNYMFHGNLFQSDSCTYGLDFYVQALLMFKRSPLSAADLDSRFVASLSALPQFIDKDADRRQYIKFFDEYGTHYLSEGSVGGTITMETEIHDSLFKSTKESEIKMAINAGYQGVISNGKFSVQEAYKASEFLRQHENSISISLSVMGGIYAPDGSIGDWQRSIYSTPIILLAVPSQSKTLSSTLLCISRLTAIAGIANDETIAKNIKTMLADYIETDEDHDGIIGSGRKIGLNQVKMAETGSGFVQANIRETRNGDRGYILGFDDDVMDPKQLRTCASQHYYTDSDVWASSASFLLPVVQGSTYKTTAMETSGNPAMNARFIGFGNTEVSALGGYETIQTNRDIVAQEDGFVVACLYAGTDGDRGYLNGIIGGKIYAGSSVHVYGESDHIVPYNGFTMPVRKGDPYRVQYTPTSGKPTVYAFFVRFQQEGLAYRDYEILDENIEFTAITDGFLMAYMHAATNGDRGEVEISCYPDKNDPTALQMDAVTSVHYYSDHDTHLPYQTATLPVPKGFNFTSLLKATSGKPKLQLCWVGIASPGKLSMTAISTDHNYEL